MPESAVTHHRMGLALERLDRAEEARASYRAAAKLGFKGAELELERMDSPKEKSKKHR